MEVVESCLQLPGIHRLSPSFCGYGSGGAILNGKVCIFERGPDIVSGVGFNGYTGIKGEVLAVFPGPIRVIVFIDWSGAMF